MLPFGLTINVSCSYREEYSRTIVDTFEQTIHDYRHPIAIELHDDEGVTPALLSMSVYWACNNTMTLRPLVIKVPDYRDYGLGDATFAQGPTPTVSYTPGFAIYEYAPDSSGYTIELTWSVTSFEGLPFSMEVRPKNASGVFDTRAQTCVPYIQFTADNTDTIGNLVGDAAFLESYGTPPKKCFGTEYIYYVTMSGGAWFSEGVDPGRNIITVSGYIRPDGMTEYLAGSPVTLTVLNRSGEVLDTGNCVLDYDGDGNWSFEFTGLSFSSLTFGELFISFDESDTAEVTEHPEAFKRDTAKLYYRSDNQDLAPFTTEYAIGGITSDPVHMFNNNPNTPDDPAQYMTILASFNTNISDLTLLSPFYMRMPDYGLAVTAGLEADETTVSGGMVTYMYRSTRTGVGINLERSSQDLEAVPFTLFMGYEAGGTPESMTLKINTATTWVTIDTTDPSGQWSVTVAGGVAESAVASAVNAVIDVTFEVPALKYLNFFNSSDEPLRSLELAPGFTDTTVNGSVAVNEDPLVSFFKRSVFYDGNTVSYATLTDVPAVIIRSAGITSGDY